MKITSRSYFDLQLSLPISSVVDKLTLVLLLRPVASPFGFKIICDDSNAHRKIDDKECKRCRVDATCFEDHGAI